MVNCLTTEVVEELQQASVARQPVDRFVESLEGATLPGLVEYGCIRYQFPQLPALPSQVLTSPVGRALEEVRSELGLRTFGQQKLAPRTLTRGSQEFIVLEGEDPTTAQSWTEYLIRFRQSARETGFEIAKATGIAAALGEMADNATLHSNAPVGILVGYQVVEGACVCCVADVGNGVLKSLTSHPAYRHLRTHKDAIRLAMQRGVTRYGPGRGGTSFNNVFKALAAMSGTLRFRSGEGCVTMDGTDFNADVGIERFVPFRQGFQVTICCRLVPQSGATPLV